MRKKLVIPIEIKKRELKGACVLASIFIRNGWTVYIGQKQHLFPHISSFSRSVWYLKSIVPGENSLLKNLKKNNHFLVSYDAEGLILNPHNKYGYKTRFSKENIDLTDLIFFWGKTQYNEFSKTFKNYKKKIFIVGSQIFDSYKIFKRRQIKEKNQILFISTFTTQIPINKKSELQILDYTTKNQRVGDLRKVLNAWSTLTTKMFNFFLDLILFMNGKLDKKIKVVIRPHPAEDKFFWIKFKKDNSLNLIIDNKTDLIDQMLESRYVVHFLSTTSILSNFLKKKTILYSNLKNIEINKYFNSISKNVSIHYFDKKRIIKDLNENNLKSKNPVKHLENAVDGFYSNDKFYSSKKIFFEINKRFKNQKAEHDKDPFNYSHLFNSLVYQLKHLVGYLIAKGYIFLGRKSSRFNHLTYRDGLFSFNREKSLKWDNTSIEDIRYLFSKINKDKINLNIKKHKSGFFKIY